MSRNRLLCFATLALAGAAFSTAAGAVTAPAGYIYSTELLGNTTQGCIAAGPAGTFVGLGPGFTANAQSIVLAKESGEVRLVASGFNSISDCAYDRAADVLYVTDNADNGDFGIASTFGAQTGDTVFAIPSASTASGLAAPGLELLPPNSVPFAASVAVAANGDVFVSDSVGGAAGSVIKIVGSTPSVLVPGMDFAAGLAFNPANGNLFAAETRDSFANQIRQFTPAGAAVAPVPFANSPTPFGTVDMLFNSDGRLLASGAFFGDVLSFNPADGTSTTFSSGLTFVGGMTVDPFTHRVQMLSSTFTTAAEDKSLHRFTPIDQLSPGDSGSADTECLFEAYGLQVVDGTATCTDGAACDSDGVENDACLFPVGFCLNVDDPDLSTCGTASDVDTVSITAKPAAAAIADAAARIAAVLPLSGSTCVFSDGYYVPVTTTGSGKKAGKAKLKVQVTNADGSKDTDTLKLVCQPTP